MTGADRVASFEAPGATPTVAADTGAGAGAAVAGPATRAAASAVLRLRGAALSYGERTLWSGLDLDLAAGEFVAVLGPNGAGKTSLIRAVLGLQALTAGSIELLGRPVSQGSGEVGYVPQLQWLEAGTPLRARDLVALGMTGTRWGMPVTSRATRRRVDEVLASVGASDYADAPVSSLSGGEQQRVRVAQAIAGRPALLLCDEPLAALDLGHQQAVSTLIDEKRRELGTAVLFVTHDVNPVLSMVDRVLYLAAGQVRVGTPDEVLTSSVLSDLYEAPVEVIRRGDRVIVIGAPDGHGTPDHTDHHHSAPSQSARHHASPARNGTRG